MRDGLSIPADYMEGKKDAIEVTFLFDLARNWS